MKKLIEQCPAIDVEELTRGLKKGATSLSRIQYGSGFTIGASIQIEANEGRTGVGVFSYVLRRPDGWEPVRLEVAMARAINGLKGGRWYFICPLDKKGQPCRRWCRKIYLAEQPRFGCRYCQNLNHRSELRRVGVNLARDPHGLKRALANCQTIDDKRRIIDAYLMKRNALRRKYGR